MKITDSKLESTMVSMAGTLIYLRDMSSMLLEKPLVPKAVEAVMAATQGELAMLQVQFEGTRRAAAADAQPFLDEWLQRRGLEVGGVFRAKSVKALSLAPGEPGAELRVCGGIAAARIHSALVNGIRVVDITLAGAEIAFSGAATVELVDEIAVREQANYNLCALRDVTVHDTNAGTSTRTLHVRIPIQSTERTRWAAKGNLIL